MKQYYLITLVLTIASGTMKPCDCEPLLSVSEEVRNSVLVVSAKVIKSSRKKTLFQKTTVVDSLGQEREETLKNPRVVNEYLLEIIRTYNGKATSDTIVLRTGIDSADCGFILELDRVYIFYLYYAGRGNGFSDARDQEPSYATDVCTRTRLFDKNEEGEIIRSVGR